MSSFLEDSVNKQINIYQARRNEHCKHNASLSEHRFCAILSLRHVAAFEACDNHAQIEVPVHRHTH